MPSQPSDAQSSRDRLLRSAKRLFALQGYEQTATSAIAREAGTSESQLMRYFGGKVGLLEVLFNDAWSDLNDRIKTALAEVTGTRQRLIAVLQTVSTALARDHELATILLFEGRRLRGPTPRVRLSEGFLAFLDLIRGLVRKGQNARELDPSLDAGAVASALVGSCEAMLRDRLMARVGGTRAFAEREVRHTLEAMLTGFAPRSTRAVRSGRRSRS